MSSQADYTATLERAVLSICLLDPSSGAKAERLVQPADFLDRRHRRLFEIIGELRERAADISPISVGLELKRLGELEAIGEEYLSGLAADPGVSGDKILEERCLKLREESMRRQAEQHLTSAAKAVRDRAIPLVDTLSTVRQQAGELEKIEGNIELPLISVAAEEMLEQLEKGLSPGTPTGLGPLDDAILGGIKNTQLVVIAGSTGQGKTALAMQIALLSAQWVSHKPTERGEVLVFSFEMSASELMGRLVMQVTPISDGYHAPHGFSNRDRPKVRAAIARIHDLPLRIDSSVRPTVGAVRGAVERFILQHELHPSLVIVDHIGLMHDPAVRGGRTEEMGAITGALKTMAMQLQIPLLVMAQLNREVGKRDDHVPQLTDLRESGTIEQDANVVMLVHRPSYYNKDLEQRALEEAKGADAFIYIAKQRSGPPATIHFDWIGPRFLFRIRPEWLERHAIPEDYGLIENPAPEASHSSSVDKDGLVDADTIFGEGAGELAAELEALEAQVAQGENEERDLFA